MHGYTTFRCFISCGFLIGISLGCSYEVLTAHESMALLITSPGYPQHNRDSQICTWDVTARDNSMYIKVTILRLEMERSNDCLLEHLTLADEKGIPDKDIARLCGMKLRPLVYESKSSMMTIRYRTRGRVPSIFRLSYQAMPKNEINLISDEERIIESPNYPGLYPSNANYWWRIKSPNGIVHMFSLEFNLQYGPSCYRDYLKAYDGYDENSELLGTWCGTEAVTARSTGSYMYLTFKSDKFEQRSGFKLSVTPQKLPSSAPESEDGSSAGIVVGSVFGALGFATIVACCRVLCCKRKGSNPHTRLREEGDSSQVSVVGVHERRQVSLVGVEEAGQVAAVGVREIRQVAVVGVDRRGQMSVLGVRQTGRVALVGVPGSKESGQESRQVTGTDGGARPISPPSYTEAVDDHPPSYFDAVNGDSQQLVNGSGSHERQAQGVDNPSVPHSTC